MNLLCPNCQTMLSVPEQNAGQLMKCQNCNKYFSVPALPKAGAVNAGSAIPSALILHSHPVSPPHPAFPPHGPAIVHEVPPPPPPTRQETLLPICTSHRAV